MMEKTMIQVECPFCGYKMPVFYDKESESHGLRAKCKGRGCKRTFEIRIIKGRQVK